MGFKKILDVIVDVETVDVFAPQWNMDNYTRSIFNVGITAVERVSRNAVFSKQIGIDKIWSVPSRFIRDFYRKNFNRSDFEMMFQSFKEFTLYFNDLLEDYNKNYNITLWSYNAMFDSAAFKENALREGVKLTNITNNWKCIMMLATHFLSKDGVDVKFANWTVETAYYNYRDNKNKMLEYITPIGNIRTTAQNVYRFITDDISFVELHKGLEDTQCEAEILRWCQGYKGWTKVNATPGIGWRNANYGFVMGKKDSGGSIGHLVNGLVLTQSNLCKVQEMINILNFEESALQEHKETLEIIGGD